MDGRTDGWMDGRTGRMDGRMDGWTDGRTERWADDWFFGGSGYGGFVWMVGGLVGVRVVGGLVGYGGWIALMCKNMNSCDLQIARALILYILYK